MAAPEVTVESLEGFRQTILSFYESKGRDLPWRRTDSAYEVLVSEMMLQQTQVDRVIPKYLAFLERFPTPQALVEAPLAEVLRAWQGLGYNRRAKYVQNAARLFVDNPTPAYDDLLSVKGIGPYTAAAVCAFAYNQDVEVADVNVRRVFKRFFGRDDVIEDALPSGRARDWYNALMDFGSSICTKKNPSCEACPLAEKCYALHHDTFGQEKTKSQKRFEGSIRWHRGQILKAVLEGPVQRDALYHSLDTQHKDREKFEQAAEQLLEEEFLHTAGGTLRARR